MIIVFLLMGNRLIFGVMVCCALMKGKFFQKTKNKQESWEKDVYPLLFKAHQCPTFSKSVSKAFPKVSFHEAKIKPHIAQKLLKCSSGAPNPPRFFLIQK